MERREIQRIRRERKERKEKRMNKYFEIQADSDLYRKYFAYKKDIPKIVAAYKEVCEKFGIEAAEFMPRKSRLYIIPTEADVEKLGKFMKKTCCGEFKRNSEPCKMWVSLVKDIENFEKPKLFYYFDLLGHRWKERLFAVEDKLYCSIESDGEVSTPDFAIEMKASEFYKIIESIEESEG